MRNKYILLSLFASFLMAGCVNEVNDTDKAGYPLSIQSVSMKAPETRATSSALTVNNATIGVSTLSGGAVSASSSYTYSTSTAKWAKALGSNDLIVNAGSYLCAYYPYSGSITNKAAIPLTSAKYSTTADLSYAYSTAAVEDACYGITHASFALQHAYAQLTFSFSHNTDYDLSKDINSVTISNPGINSSASLDITKPAAVYSSKVVSDVVFNPGITDIDATTDASVLMVPTDVLTGNITVQIQVGTAYKVLSIPVSYFANSKLEAGVNYRISVYLSAKGNISIGSTAVQATDWVGGTATNNSKTCLEESNCYIVAPNSGSFRIPVSRANTGAYFRGETAPLVLGITSFTAGILWSDVDGVVASADADVANGEIIVTPNTGTLEGNAVLYAKNTAGDIIWSWHIWVTNYNPDIPSNGTIYISTNSMVWMDRNLGATTIADGTNTFATCGGLMYQWGRKDPFPGSNGTTTGSATAKTISGYAVPTTIGTTNVTAISGDTQVKRFSIGTTPVTYANAFGYSVKNPLVFFLNWAGSTATAAVADTEVGGKYSWNSSADAKTPYDPCPVGWRVPAFIGGTTSPWAALPTSLAVKGSGATASQNFQSYNYGNYPIPGNRNGDNGVLSYVGTHGDNWAATGTPANAYDLYINGSAIDRADWAPRSYACSVRCVKE